jgi:Flp pilus assembly protein TadD
VLILQHLFSAARHYRRALELQTGNIYAANGLGAVAASLGQLDAARSILSQLRESAALASGFVEVPDVRS